MSELISPAPRECHEDSCGAIRHPHGLPSGHLRCRCGDLYEHRLRTQIASIHDKFPDLLGWGFRDYRCDAEAYANGRSEMLQPFFARQVTRAQVFLEMCHPCTRINLDAHSYELKHVGERWHRARFPNVESYISNGAFIVAAILGGFQWRRCKYPGENERLLQHQFSFIPLVMKAADDDSLCDAPVDGSGYRCGPSLPDEARPDYHEVHIPDL